MCMLRDEAMAILKGVGDILSFVAHSTMLVLKNWSYPNNYLENKL